MLARVVRVEQAARGRGLVGAGIDFPVVGTVSSAQRLELRGWALGRGRQPRHVSFFTGDDVPARAWLVEPREDVAESFPDVAAARTCGFGGGVHLAGAGRSERVVVAAVWRDRSRTPLGAIHIERFWARDPDPGIAALVSIAVLGGDGDEIARSLESARLQGRASCELVVVGRAHRDAERAAASFGSRHIEPESCGDAGAYATAIRRTNGDMLVFLRAGRTLREGALASAVAQLRAASLVAAVFDLGATRDPLGEPALFRRSALRALAELDVPFDQRPQERLLGELRARYTVEGLRVPR